MAALTLLTPAFAQAPVKKPNLIQRHPTATGVVAGVATHAALKRSAAWKKKHHQKLNFAEKHPTLTGIAAGLTTRAVIKHTTPKKP
jgi:hypothetical protein